jgi:uncharacterized YccA/Bax inhibitor family protein
MGVPYYLPMANPLLNDKAFSKAVERTPDQAGWAAPKGGSAVDTPTTWNSPISDGPVSPWRSANPMTANGAMSATLFLMVLLVGAATFGWSSVQTVTDGNVSASSIPSWAFMAMIVGFVSVLVATFKPTTARFLAPVYALAQGAVVGAISKVFNIQYPGIVLQAVGATIGVFVVMLTLYRTGILRVTDKFRRIVIGATLGLAAFYLFSFIAGFFGANLIPSGSSTMSIGFSVLVAGLAAMNLALDFDFIDKAEAAGAPKHMEWFAALGIMVTLVWLYLEILRLLAKMRDR